MIGVIGQMVLSRMLILLDMPHGEVMYITTSNNSDCDDVGQQILGDRARSVRLDGDFQIPAFIDGKKRWFSMNPDLDVTSVPTSWDDLPEVAHPTLVRAEKTITRFDRFLTAGREAKIKDFEIGGERIKDDTVVLQRDIMTGHIGMPFLQIALSCLIIRMGVFTSSQLGPAQGPRDTTSISRRPLRRMCLSWTEEIRRSMS